jgi:hypothetical protein
VAQKSEEKFSIAQNTHLIIPLFSSRESFIEASSTSKKPEINRSVEKVRDINTSGM